MEGTITKTPVDPSIADRSQTVLMSERRVRDRNLPAQVWVVAVICFWEKFTFWGLTAPWQNYMENAPHRGSGAPGALKLGQAMSTRIYCAFYIFYYTTPLFFAVLSDMRLGRFKTLRICAILYVVGCGVLMLSSLEKSLKLGFGLPGLIVAMVLVGLGGGGFKMLMNPFIADQYTAPCPRKHTTKQGEPVIIDRAETMQYIYNMYFWMGNVGSLSWFATTALETYYSFTIAYSITFASMIIAMLTLTLGGKWYVEVPLEENVLPKASKALICASRNGFSMARADPDYQRDHHGKIVPWSSRFVSELDRGLRTCRVFIAFVVFYTCFSQMQNNLVSQAKHMETHSIPNDMVPAINQVACIIFGPIVQYGLYPFLNRRHIKFGPIARITIGFAFMALAMLYATLVQHFIYSTGPCFKTPGQCEESGFGIWRGPNHINVWIQTPVYIFIAIAEIFALVTVVEYANEHSPKDMKAIVQAISLLIAGVGSACAMGLSPIARDPQLVILYGCLFGAMTATTAIFWWVFHKYDKLYPADVKDDEGVEMDSSLESVPRSATNSTLD